MIALILFIVFGILFSFFATMNTSPVTLQIGSSTLTNIPIYLVVLSSVGLGVVFATIFYFVKTISYKFAFGRRKKELADKNKEIAELTRELHKLEIENTKLKTKTGEEQEDDDSI